MHYFLLFLLKNIDCGYSLEPPHRGGSNEYHNLYYEQKYEKYQIFFYLKFFQFLEVKLKKKMCFRCDVERTVDCLRPDCARVYSVA